MIKDFSHIFIIGVSRTGSKFYMQLLNSHDSINIITELVFYFPYKKDFYSIIQSAYKRNLSVNDLIENLYEAKLKDTSIEILEMLDKDQLVQQISAYWPSSNPYLVLDTIISLSAKSEGKHISGAKFPVHYSKCDELLNNFPNSKILYLIRDPRDIFLSDLKLKMKGFNQNSTNFPFKGILLKPMLSLFTINQWRNSVKKYFNLVSKYGVNKIKLFKYEDMILNQNRTINEVASFLETDAFHFKPDQIIVIDPSFDQRVMNRWKNELGLFYSLMFRFLTGKYLKKLGYSL